MPGLGLRPPMMPPVRMPPTRTSGVPQNVRMSGGGSAMGGPPLPGTREYSQLYGDWMKTPEAQGVFQQDAVNQAKLANALNPYSSGYNATSAEAMKDAVRSAGTGMDYYNTGAGRIREAMGQVLTSAPQGPVAGGPAPATTRPPVQPPAPMPPVMNNFSAAATLRKRRRGGGPAAPPVLA